MPTRGIKALEDRKEDKAKKAFQDEIQFFLSKDTFTMYDFHERVLQGLDQKSSLKMMVLSDDAEFKELENQNKICSAMSDAEKTFEKKLNLASK